jgi:hypothetical protein
MSDSDVPNMRSYGCTFGCGNPYDYVIVSVADNSVEMLCVPCYVRLAADMIAAITEPSDPGVMEALRAIGMDNAETVPGPSGNPRGHNAPVGADDPAVFEAFNDVITVEDLPDEFR